MLIYVKIILRHRARLKRHLHFETVTVVSVYPVPVLCRSCVLTRRLHSGEFYANDAISNLKDCRHE